MKPRDLLAVVHAPVHAHARAPEEGHEGGVSRQYRAHGVHDDLARRRMLYQPPQQRRGFLGREVREEALGDDEQRAVVRDLVDPALVAHRGAEEAVVPLYC